MSDLFFKVTSPGYVEPMSDGENFFTINHPTIGDVLTSAGRVLDSKITLGEAGETYLNLTITVC